MLSRLKTQQKKVTVEAKSTGSPIDPEDVKVEAKGSAIQIDVRPRGEKNRIDLVVTIPTRSKVEVEGQAGAVDVIGSVESAVVKTDTGTIHADVPLEAVKFNFVWEASKPRYMSDVELPPVQGKGGRRLQAVWPARRERRKEGRTRRSRLSHATRRRALEHRSGNGAE